MNNKKNREPALDVVFSVLLIIFGIYIVVTSLGLKYFNSFIDGAGFFPCIIGSVLVLLGAVLLYIGVKLGGVAQLKEIINAEGAKSFLKNDATIRVLILIAMMVIYMFVLIGNIHFIIATSIYIFATYMYLGACKKFWVIPGWAMAIIISVVSSTVIYYGMKIFLGVTMP